jgi:hypothetical protein
MAIQSKRILKRPYTALIGDIVGSRQLAPVRRREIQHRLSKLIALLNRIYKDKIVAKFVITLGDEFQAIIADPQIVPDLIWRIGVENDFFVRLGFGYGTLTTAVPEYAINVDGPALHQARVAIERAKKEKTMGGVFLGFGQTLDTILNGLASELQFHRETRSEQQIKIIKLLREGYAQSDIADTLEVTKQTVWQHVQAAGWESYHKGEDAFCASLTYVSHNPL